MENRNDLVFVHPFQLIMPHKRKQKEHQSGYSLGRFIDRPIPEFICKKCEHFVKRPVECSQCGVLYCFYCVFSDQASLRRSPELPCVSCECVVGHREVSKVLKRMINDLEIHCKYKGCSSIVPLSSVKSHEKQCPLKTVKCNSCRHQGLLRDFRTVNDYRNGLFGPSLSSLFACSERCSKLVDFERILTMHQRESVLKAYFRELQQQV